MINNFKKRIFLHSFILGMYNIKRIGYLGRNLRLTIKERAMFAWNRQSLNAVSILTQHTYSYISEIVLSNTKY